LKVGGRQPVAAGIVSRIDPDGNNRIWIDLLAEVEPAACAPLEKTLADYRNNRRTLLQSGEERQRERLARNHGISGSAVIPNPLTETACREALDSLKRQTLTVLQQQIQAVSSFDQT